MMMEAAAVGGGILRTTKAGANWSAPAFAY
jgi:hypothetical protein